MRRCWRRRCSHRRRTRSSPSRVKPPRNAPSAPLVQCAGGMRMHDPLYLRRARELCDVHGVFLIADEIAVGFGRTGTLFACEQAGIMPDLLCLSKGLTGGFLPLAAVLATQAIF